MPTPKILPFLFALLFFVGCGGGLKATTRAGRTPPVINDPPVVPALNLSPLSITLVRLDRNNVPATDSSVQTGTVVRFRVTATGGYGRFVLASLGTTQLNTSFSNSLDLATIYGTAVSGKQEMVVVKSLDLNGAELENQTVNTIAFDIVAPPAGTPPTYACQITANTTKATIAVDANRTPIGSASPVNINITHNGNNPSVTLFVTSGVTATSIAPPPGSVNTLAYSLNITSLGTASVTANLTFGSSGNVPCGVSIEVKDQVQRYVDGLYKDLLQRERVAGEGVSYETALYAKQPLINVASAFVNSTEYRTKLIQRYYSLYLNRAADSGGLNFYLAKWTELTANNEDAQTFVQKSLLASTEAQNRFTVPQDYVNFVFNSLFSRDPSTAEAASGLQYFNDYGAGELVLEYINSDSFRTRFLTLLYRDLLRREPDAGGLQSHLSQMVNGSYRPAKTMGFASSNEYFALRFLRPEL